MQTKFKTLLLSFALLLSGAFSVNAQDAHRGGFLENWSVGVDAGLYGFGGYVATSLLPNIKARVGFDYLTYTYKDNISFDAPPINVNNESWTGSVDMNGELTDPSLKFPNFKALVDFYPVTDGIFCLTAGFYMGNNNVNTDGMINGYEELSTTLGFEPAFEFEDIIIQPDPNGKFNAKLKMGNSFKPYLGIGLGRTISKSRVGFRFDLGVVFQGEYTVESRNVVKGIDKINDEAADFDLGVSKELLKLWPMMSFSLSYRIK